MALCRAESGSARQIPKSLCAITRTSPEDLQIAPKTRRPCPDYPLVQAEQRAVTSLFDTVHC